MWSLVPTFDLRWSWTSAKSWTLAKPWTLAKARSCFILLWMEIVKQEGWGLLEDCSCEILPAHSWLFVYSPRWQQAEGLCQLTHAAATVTYNLPAGLVTDLWCHNTSCFWNEETPSQYPSTHRAEPWHFRMSCYECLRGECSSLTWLCFTAELMVWGCF